ncbi:MAG: DUF3499 domain-containing protein [Arcanobacterium sp.]|nr:DUF3499 domain-containing protein [Arcanobacterium sp.]
MTYSYKEATAVIGPLSPVPQPGALDLCADHALTVTVPVGWQMVRLVTEFEPVAPSTDDLTALADAIRATSRKSVKLPEPARREVRRPAATLNTRPRLRPHFQVVPGEKPAQPDRDEREPRGAQNGMHEDTQSASQASMLHAVSADSAD